jgi:hypothetical protein
LRHTAHAFRALAIERTSTSSARACIRGRHPEVPASEGETAMRPGDKITQIVPAAGYYAVYREGDETTYNPVAAWVVVEDENGLQRVDGIDPSRVGWDGSPCSHASEFVEFVYREERERRR